MVVFYLCIAASTAFGQINFVEDNTITVTPDSGRANYICSADFDNDGDLDLLVRSSTGDLTVYENEGGVITHDDPHRLGVSGTYAVAGHFDDDQLIDLAAYDSSEVKIYSNDGGFHFIYEVTVPEVYPIFGGMVASDFDSNLRNEIAFVWRDLYGNPPNFYVAEIDDDYNITLHKTGFDEPLQLGGLVVGDFDGDGDQDAICCGHLNQTNGKLVGFENNGSFLFTRYDSNDMPNVGARNFSRMMRAANINGDAPQDIVLRGFDGGNYVLAVISGNLDWSAFAVNFFDLPINGSIEGLDIADFNNDELDDVAVAAGNTNTIAIYENITSGATAFIMTEEIVGYKVLDVSAIDYTSDGNDDLAGLSQEILGTNPPYTYIERVTFFSNGEQSAAGLTIEPPWIWLRYTDVENAYYTVKLNSRPEENVEIIIELGPHPWDKISIEKAPSPNVDTKKRYVKPGPDTVWLYFTPNE